MLRDDEYFTDVTLATEGHSVKAHRVILSACSNYFHAILKGWTVSLIEFVQFELGFGLNFFKI